ncbi:Crp/Fnr family transcriptional regulator [Phreatobacter stygius]|uniref:Crp/Fnr family transcriptional regulator n=2 Tax=Phreatobacter stygius TaxID=1940610 RepID=A0A4D7B8A6_9HYPH|nr:Crp/Fnr family transcriptional regulator [Phreatobacter stygius]
MRVNFVNIRQILEQNAWFRACPPGLQDGLIEHSQVVEIADGDYLCRRGDPATGLFCLIEGRLRIGGSADDGHKEAILAIIEPPYWFGELELFDEGPRGHDARAEGAVTVLNIPQAALKAVLEREPRYWRELGLLAASKTRLAFKALEDSASGSSLTRVARRILAIFDGYGLHSDGQKTLLTASQEQLALMLGMSRQTVNQHLGKLEKQEVIRRHYGGIEILDAAKLSEIGGVRS